jgi:hypothetical protein
MLDDFGLGQVWSEEKKIQYGVGRRGHVEVRDRCAEAIVMLGVWPCGWGKIAENTHVTG